MAVSEVEICNMSLTQLGAKRITALTEDSKNARECNAVFDRVRDAVLTDYIWPFAQKRVALATVDEEPAYTDDLITVVYAKPADYLQLNFVNVKGAKVRVEGNRILSDTASLKIKYTFRQEDTTIFHPKFTEAFAGRLAAEIAFAITSNRALMTEAFGIYYEKKLPQATSIVAMQETPLRPMQDEVTGARFAGSGQLHGQTSWETWFPICWF